MDKNNQNKSTNENYLQLLLEPISSPGETKILTISEDQLNRLGIENYLISGVTWTSEGHPISYGIFDYNVSDGILNKIYTILDASIVNSEQRKAVKILIEEVVRTRQFDLVSWISRRTKEVQSNPDGAAGDNGILIEQKSY